MSGSFWKSLRNHWTQWLSAWLRGSIVTRTTLAIFVPAMILGLAFALIVSVSVERSEQQRAEVRLQQLLSTVETTAQIACYLKDRSLAGEIAHGLISNRAVSGVTITSGDLTLAHNDRTAPAHAVEPYTTRITRPIYSPFDAREQVGSVTLFVDRAAIHAEAASYSRTSTFAMVLEVMLVAAGVALAVYFFSTRPIKGVSNELHRIRFDSGARLQVPPSNRRDEIGTLVTDVNALISSLADLLSTERDLRIAHELGERKLRLIFEKTESGLLVLDDSGRLESWNPAFVRLLRLAPGQLPQSGVTTLQDLLAPHAAHLSQLIRQCLTTGQSYEADLEMQTREGSPIAWIGVALNPIGPTSLQGIVNDITARKQSEISAKELASLATEDTLTGLLNRRGLDIGLSAALSLHPAASTPSLALLQIDLDYFKEVNDQHGHESGDRVLRHVAGILEHNTRIGDLIARPGGDEFVIALLGLTDPSKAERIAHSIIAEIEQPIDLGHAKVKIGASIGISFVLPNADSPQALLARADAAMYCAKRGGRGQVRLAPPPELPRQSAVA